MTNSPRQLLRVAIVPGMMLAMAVAALPVFGQTAVAVDVKVVTLPIEEMDQLRLSAASPSFARALSKAMADYLADETRSKSVHRIDLQATNGKSSQFSLDSRVSALPTGSLENQSIFNIGIGIEVTPKVFQNRDISLMTASQVRVRRGPDANGGESVIFENPPTKFETRIQEGVTIILGGFITDAERMKLPAIPILPDNPILNYLFSKAGAPRGMSEIAVLMTPRIVGPLLLPATELPAPVSSAPAAPAVPAVLAAVPAPAPTPAAKPVSTATPPASANAVPGVPAVAPVASADSKTAGLYTVQVGAFETQDKAEALVAQLSKKYSDVFIEKVSTGKVLYHVRVGRLPDRTAARQIERRLTQDGFATYVTTLD